MKKYHYVYKITCLKPNSTQKYYIGVHSSNKEPDLDSQYWGSSKYLNNSIKEIGLKNFRKEILSIWDTRELANNEEIRLHREYDVSRSEEYYNKNNATTGSFCSLGQVTVKNIKTGNFQKVSIDELKNNIDYIHNSKGRTTIYDISTKRYINVSVEEAKSNPNYKNSNTKIFKIFDTEDNLRFECFGNFKEFCEYNNLPYNAFRESIRENKKIYTNSNPNKRQYHFIEYKGWYAKRYDMV